MCYALKVLFVFVLFINGSLPLASAQDVYTNPNVRVSNILLDRGTYSAGETVKGSFTLSNAKDIDVSDLFYEISLVGDYTENTLAETFYDAVKLGPLYIKGLETRGIEFEYVLPKSVSGDKLGIQIGAMLGTGFRMGWGDAFLSVKGQNTFLSISQAFISIAEEDFDLQIGPIVYPEEQALLQFSLSNKSGSKVEILAKNKIINRANPGVVAREESLPGIVVLPKSTSTLIKYILPRDFSADGVYTGTVEFFDKAGNKVAPNLDYRYILGKDFATIKGLTINKTIVDKGDEVKVIMDFSGSVFDVRNSELDHSAEYDLSISLLSESGKEIASYGSQFDFNQTGPAGFILEVLDTGEIYRSEVLVTNGGKIITSYSSILPSIEGVKDYTYLYYVSAFVLLFLSIVVMLFRRHMRPLLLIFFVLVLSASYLTVSAFTVTSSGRSGAGDSPTIPSVYINAPVNTYASNQQFYLTGSVSAKNCDNQYLYFKIFYKRNAGDAWTLGATYLNKNGRVSHGTTNIQRTNQFSIGPFNAPASIGNYNMFVRVEAYAYWNSTIKTGESSFAEGYQPYSVANFVLSPNGALSCNTSSVNLVWDKFSGQTVYNIRVNDWSSPWTTTWNGSQSSPCQNVATGDLCINNIDIGSAGQGLQANFPVQAGHTYHYWIDVPALGISSPALTFSVPSNEQCASQSCYLPTDIVYPAVQTLGVSPTSPDYVYSYHTFDSSGVNSGTSGRPNANVSNVIATTSKFSNGYYLSNEKYIDFGWSDIYFQVNGQKTISIWVRPDQQTHTGVILSKYRTDTSEGGYFLQMDSQNRVSAGIKSNSWVGGTTQGPVYTTPLSSSLPANSWTHLAVKIDTSSSTKTIALYVNGDYIGKNTQNSSGTFTNANAPFLIGAEWYGPTNSVCDTSNWAGVGCKFVGAVDDFFVISKLLTDCEIKKLAKGANACGEPCPPLLASCEASPATVPTGSLVTWTATSTNATGTVKYSWVFDDWASVNSSTTAMSISGIYSNYGTKYATTTISDARSTTTAACYSELGYGGQYSLGVNILQKINAVCSNDYNSCSLGSPELIYPSEDTDTTHFWKCRGVNGGADAPGICQADKSLPPEPLPGCSVRLINPQSGNRVTINTNTKWELENNFDDSLYDVNWVIREGSGKVSTTTDAGYNIDRIFDTVGLKEVSIYLSSSTSNKTWYCSGGGNLATTSVVTQDSLLEI